MRRLVLLTLFLSAQLLTAQTFTKVTDPSNDLAKHGATPGYTGVSWIDYNGDGWDDCFINPNHLYRNDGDGTFTKVNFGPASLGLGNGATWGDYDNDGDPDVMIAASPSVLYQQVDTGFLRTPLTAETIDTFNFWSAAWGDYDQDGWLDLVLIHPAGFLGFNGATVSRPNLLFHNNRDGSFRRVTDSPVDNELAAYTVVTWTDYDLDDDLDIFIGSGEVAFLSKDHIFINQLSETDTARLVRLTTGALATDLRDGQNWNLIDYDLDGDLDAFVTNYTPTKSNDLYRNDNGTYVRMTQAQAGPIANGFGNGLNNTWADFDNDGYIDCFVTNDGNQKDIFYHNNGNGTFSIQEKAFSITATTRGASAADYDNDGFMDLMVSSVTATAAGLYHNEGNANHWFQLRLQGATDNRSAIGAKVRVKADLGSGRAVWQIREVNSQNTFNGHNSYRVHFGLGQAEVIDSLEVIWPGGDRQLVAQVAANQICELTQGQSSNCNVVSVIEPGGGGAQLRLLPNPAGRDRVVIAFDFPRSGTVNWRLLTADGRRLPAYEGRLTGIQSGEIPIDTSRLAAGMYIVQLEQGAYRISESLIVR